MLCLCLDPGSSFQSSIQCLSSDHGSNCDLDAYGTHPLLNGSLSPSQQDRSDLMKAPGFNWGSTYASGVHFYIEPECFQFDTESDLSSSNVQCFGSDSGSPYGSDVAFSDKTACLPSEAGHAHASAISFLTQIWWLSFDRDTAHEPEIPFLAEIPFDFKYAYESNVSVSNVIACLSFDTGFVYESNLSSSTLQCSGSDLGPSYGSDIPFLAEIAVDAEHEHGFGLPSSTHTACLSLKTTTTHGRGIPCSTDTVCLSCDTRFVAKSDLPFSKEISSETTYGSKKPCSTDIVCLSSELEAPSESDVPFSDKSARLSCGLQSASRCGNLDLSGHLGTTKTSFDCETAHEPDVPHWTQTPNETESAHDNVLDSAHTVRLPSERGIAYAPDVPRSKEIPSEATYGFENSSSTDTVCLSSEPEASYESDILHSTDTAFLPCELGPAYASVVPFLTETRCLQFECDTVHEPDIPLSADTLFGFRFAYDSDILDSTDAVCLWSETETTYEYNIFDSTDTACRPCESGPAYASN
eukprot:SAG31_NODE_6740_length_1903_cov_2.594789_1_plen_524_part_01